MPRVLVADDDPALLEVLAETLRRAGYDVDTAGDGADAVAKVRDHAPDLLLLDYEMPKLDAGAVLEHLRRADGSLPVPVIIFTGGRVGVADEVLGFERGVVDYIRKGADREVLLVRVASALRRGHPQRTLVRGRMLIELGSRRIRLGSQTIELEPRQFDVLLHLAEREGEVVTRDGLLLGCWGTRYGGFNHAIDQAIYGVRKSLGEPGWIQTVSRRGYRFVSRP